MSTDAAEVALGGGLMAPSKPLLRGVSHLVAFFISLATGALLLAWAPSPVARWGALTYAASLSLLFGVSALYHRPHWSPAARKWMRRLDHAAIFVLIAGTTTPVALSLPGESRAHLLAIVWAGAGLGVARALVWVDAPKVLVALLGIGLGWTAMPYMGELSRALGSTVAGLVVAGGFLYSLGAIVYARKRPDPWPRVFGYHELFHAFTIAAAVCHFIAVQRITAALFA